MVCLLPHQLNSLRTISQSHMFQQVKQCGRQPSNKACQVLVQPTTFCCCSTAHGVGVAFLSPHDFAGSLLHVRHHHTTMFQHLYCFTAEHSFYLS